MGMIRVDGRFIGKMIRNIDIIIVEKLRMGRWKGLVNI